MEPPERVEIDPYADNHVLVTEGDSQFAEAVGELPQDNGLNGQSGNGMLPEAGDWHNGPPPQGAAGVDAGRTLRAGHWERPCRRFFWTLYGLHAVICGS